METHPISADGPPRHALAEALRAVSRSLGEFLDQDPNVLAMVESGGPLPDATGYRLALTDATASGGLTGLRVERRRRLAQIAALDLVGEISLEEVGVALSDLADACLQASLEHQGSRDILSVIAMGKYGGRELNYSSDIDLMFVSHGDREAAHAAEELITTLGEFSPEGQAYRIDLNLRPEGRSGALVRPLESYLEYYRRWAKTWEFQALIKARAAAGDLSLGTALVEQTRPMVFTDDVSPERIAEIRKMKERLEEHALRSARRGRTSDAEDVKLGPGGIRDIEFVVQLLQLVHGGADETVRSGNTLAALGALVNGGYVAEDDAAGMSVAYRWLRNVEHRLQLWQERQVHHLPRDPDSTARLARSMGFKDDPSASAAERFLSAHRGVLADVRSRFERIFYRPMIESLAEAGARGLSGEALGDRLRVLGFRDVDRATRTLSTMVTGTSRRAKLFRLLTPALLRYLALTPVPDEGLFSFLRLGEALEDRLDALGALRENPPGIEFLARVLGSGRFLGNVLLHVPEEISTIADPRGPREPKDRERLIHEAMASLRWRDPASRLDGLRRFKRREMLRVGLADLGGVVDVRTTGLWLSDLADGCLEAALSEIETPVAVIGMGKLGGRELNYSSDIDVMFVANGDPMAAERAAEELMRSIGEVTPEGQAFRIDPGLRPEGKSGPLVRSVESYVEYYERWAQPWEFLAIGKARAAAGDPVLGNKLVEALHRFAYPEHVTTDFLSEIRHLKARMERERIPRGTDPRRHLKLGPGGLSDIEFAVQMLQMEHGLGRVSLRVSGTLEALEAARAEALLDEEQAHRMREAYEFLMRLRNCLFFLFGRPQDSLPVKPEDLEALGVSMGFIEQPRQEIEEEYLRVTRRARRVCDPLIYG
jgi:[glutamine synthetase] adenylyltransferase / [glutamine synthetase]-adenylyl-L-tyrosine phosphorylase